ncbi:uncharacterized protein BDZ99DRAFT_517786 [Mytilinidion resinicola]|uniref:Uncharacterized protein n=1 Tax=Mytilinidion resinicola TaxID=574789 RepID=A0A6A6YZY4_9PEZI|nr:uncharacterized protein BDZ99DRAFT_517786 [Mytilinidion resinicola]KAF2813537.1 hypothetical protein BDZ99DRAFT_517786 [Mytilinidion resinicola]
MAADLAAAAISRADLTALVTVLDRDRSGPRRAHHHPPRIPAKPAAAGEQLLVLRQPALTPAPRSRNRRRRCMHRNEGSEGRVSGFTSATAVALRTGVCGPALVGPEPAAQADSAVQPEEAPTKPPGRPPLCQCASARDLLAAQGSNRARRSCSVTSGYKGVT